MLVEWCVEEVAPGQVRVGQPLAGKCDQVCIGDR
jgi:hypothetical protein